MSANDQTTRARLWVSESPETRCRINRDETRLMLHDLHTRSSERERAVTLVLDASVRALLTAGFDVVVDDPWTETGWIREAVEVWDVAEGRCTERIAVFGSAARGDGRTGRAVVIRGLPGCGKTTRARLWVAEAPETRCRINRDDFRTMFHGVRYTGISECERAVTVAQYASIRAALTAGFDVVSDDTWLVEDNFVAVLGLASDVGAIVDVWDWRDVPPQVCIERDAARGTLVGAEVINDLYRRFVAS